MTTTAELNLGKYHCQTAASALLFEDVFRQKGLRIEAPGICKEFTDNSYIGSDPQGILYFYNVDDFEPQDTRQGTPVPSYYKVRKLVGAKDSQVHIIFWGENGKEEKPFAEFVGEDPAGLVSAYNMDGYTAKGAWVDLDMSVCTAYVRKLSTNDTITLTIDSINGMTAVWDASKSINAGDPRHKLLDGTALAVSGNLSFKKLADLKKGIFAKYNNDHIVFYASDFVSKDFTAYFIPSEFSMHTLGVPPKETQIYMDVVWSA